MTCQGCSFAGQSTALEKTYVGVRFGEETNLTLCATSGRVVVKGERLVVAMEGGPAVGWVVKSPMPVFTPCQKTSARAILRLATAHDLEANENRLSNETRARLFARERIRELSLRMKVARVDFSLNGRNALFYFTADGRVDFRQLVRDLARRFRTRVRMVQLGPRDEAKLLGGVGICGKTLCCSSWMGEFRSISVQMAKRQGLSLNPSKISGQCGRLLCCLKYEDDQYRERRSGSRDDLEVPLPPPASENPTGDSALGPALASVDARARTPGNSEEVPDRAPSHSAPALSTPSRNRFRFLNAPRPLPEAPRLADGLDPVPESRFPRSLNVLLSR